MGRRRIESGERKRPVKWMRAGWLLLAVLSGAGYAGAQQLPDAPAPSVQQAASAVKAKGFWGRWGEFYRDDWNGTAAKAAATAPAAARRGVPSPLDSPPFPSADWSYGGSPTIGEADGNVYPLQTAINGAKGRT
jgi:hypothetical protein